MSEIQFQMIVKIISNGAPALAEELCGAIANVLDENLLLKAEVERLKAPTKPATETAEETV